MKISSRMLRTASYTVLILFSLLPLLPLVLSTWGSFIDIRGIMVMPPKLTSNLTITNYTAVFAEWEPIWIVNTVIITILVVGGSVLISVLTGYGLRKYNKRWVRLFLIAAVMIPRYGLAIPQVVIIRYIGLGGTLLAAAIPLFVTPMHIFLSEEYFRSFPREMIEAGRLDGLSETGVFFRILLPNSKSLIAFLVIMKTTEAWGDYLWQYIVLQAKKTQTLLVGLVRSAMLTGGYAGEMQVNPVGTRLAITVLLMIPFIFLFAFCSKYFIYELKGVD